MVLSLLTDEEKRIEQNAIKFARENKKPIAKKLTNILEFPEEDKPVSVFMAGSPGAGKTESSKLLILGLSKNDHSILRIDSDEYRVFFDEYTGINSHLFQAATSIIVEKVHDFALDNQQSFVFDGTLSNTTKAMQNITRSIHLNRPIQILYVYQDPLQAWQFVKARETQDGRIIHKQTFIEQYFKARMSVNEIKKAYGSKVEIDLIVKNIDGTNLYYTDNIDIVDNYIPEKYSELELNQLIN